MTPARTQPQKAPFAALALALAFLCASAPASRAASEYIICSGGPALPSWEELRVESHRHDRWWGNFIRTARIRIEQLREAPGGDGLAITWLVYRPGYTLRGKDEGRSLIDLIGSVRDKYGVTLVWFDSGDDVVNYLNAGKNRREVKISGFEFYGHSNRHCFMFDYSSEIIGVSTAYLHENHLGRIRGGLFLENAHVQSYGCHTGESMSEKWRRATGVNMIGAVGKTDYAYSWQGTLPIIHRGYWKR